MRTSGFNRRQFMATGIGAALAMLPWRLHAASPAADALHLLSPARFNGEYVLAHTEGKSAMEAETNLPFRGHGLVLDPRNSNRALIMARRPGTEAILVDLPSGKILRTWQSEEDRHFYGHACFSADGKAVFTTENDIDTGDGIISVRDASDFSVLDEYPSYGIGPHELLMMPDGHTLVVANGGIKTFPETGRVKLNRGKIASSLAYIDSRSGKLADSFAVPLPHLSLRHLAITPDGQVAGAMQYEGEEEAGQPLLLFHRGESSLQIAAAPQQVWDRMENYAASIAYDARNQCFALTCPKGDAITVWKADRRYQGAITFPKASGVTFADGKGYASNELGQICEFDASALKASLYADKTGLEWDNHLYLGIPRKHG
jgi:hypothetical protein